MASPDDFLQGPVDSTFAAIRVVVRHDINADMAEVPLKDLKSELPWLQKQAALEKQLDS